MRRNMPFRNIFESSRRLDDYLLSNVRAAFTARSQPQMTIVASAYFLGSATATAHRLSVPRPGAIYISAGSDVSDMYTTVSDSRGT